MARRHLLFVASVVFACALGVPGEVAAGPDPAVRAKNYVMGYGRLWVHHALAAAIQRLEQPRCRQIFDDFSDAQGLPLSARLRELRTTPEEYLVDAIVFAEGSMTAGCAFGDVAAFTEPGSRVVYICGTRVASREMFASDGDVVILHEMLHSLGLGENPPSSHEITGYIMNRCGV